MAVCAHIVGDSDTTLWGLSGRERLRRALIGQRGIDCFDDLAEIDEGDTLIILRGDYIYDSRILDSLAEGAGAIAVSASDDKQIVAARVMSADAPAVAEALRDGNGPLGMRVQEPVDLATGARTRLKGMMIPRIDPISADHRDSLESHLFSGAYKGVTDLVTKWLWPAPAARVTRACIALGITPNMVTTTSLVLAVLAGWAFAVGAFWPGLVAAWVMTFLDTVDGKLARVTITSSNFGDKLDHGLDLLHPPLWYLAWGAGLGSWVLWPGFETTVIVIFAGYIGGRLCEAGFRFIAPFSLFLWRPFDSVNRLITARRNPNLLLLTGSLIAGRPDIGLWLVAAWHLISTAILLLRLATAIWHHKSGDPVGTWLDDVDPITDRDRAVVRMFTQVPPRS